MRPITRFIFSVIFSTTIGLIYHASHANEVNPTSGILSVAFGKPTYIQRLYYQKMYAKKPFHDAILLYYDNGLYKIISPGEEHYGSYVIQGSFNDQQYTVHYIAFPSADWNNTSAYHVLEFDREKHRFTQHAIVPIDGKIPEQDGIFSISENKVVNPIKINWENGKNLLPALFSKEIQSK